MTNGGDFTELANTPQKPLVVHLIPKLAVGGATKCTLYQASRTAALGYEAVVVAGTEPCPEGAMHGLAERLGVRLEPLDAFRNSILTPLADRRAVEACRRLVGDRRPVVVHTHGGKGHVIGAMLKRRIPDLHLVHQVHGWSWREPPRGLRDRLLIMAERWACGVADVVGVVTTLDVKKGLDLGIAARGKYRLMRSGVDLADFRPWTPRSRQRAREALCIEESARVVCHVGRLAPQKAPHRLIDLAEYMHGQDDYRFVLVGGGQLEREVRQELARRKLPRRLILVLGHRDNVPELLAAMDLVLLLSDYEGLPRTLVEGLATGLPIAARAVDGVNEIINSPTVGGLVPVNADTAETARIVSETIARSRMDVESVLARRQRAEEFGLLASLEQTLSVYRELLGGAAPNTDLRPIFLEDIVRAIDLLEQEEAWTQAAPEAREERPAAQDAGPRERRTGSDRRVSRDRRKSGDLSTDRRKFQRDRRAAAERRTGSGESD